MILRSILALGDLLWHLRWSPDRLRRWQEEGLRRTVKWASERVPLYREKFRRKGLDPRGVCGLGDLASIPVTERQELWEQGEGALAQGVDLSRCSRFTTSGSCGMPISAVFSPAELSVRNAAGKRTLLAYRQPPWASMLRVGNPRPLRPSPYQRLGIYSETRASAFLSQFEQSAMFRAHRPRILAGYPSSLKLLGETLGREGGPIHSPRLVLSGGEVLLPSTRSFLASTFKAPVRDWYGIEEMGLLAWECPQGGGYHLTGDMAIFEVVDGDSSVEPGNEGELLVTSLFLRTMPLIRYRLDDRVIAEPDPCPCGCAFPRIRRILGRSDDLLQLPTGEWVHPVVAACGVVDLPGVERFRIVQEAQGAFRVELVRAEGLSEELIAKIRSHFESHLGARTVIVKRVDHILVQQSGKLRNIVFGAEGERPAQWEGSPLPLP